MVFYALAIFISAFMLFQIQPLIGKYFLPWFGGTPAVWSASMLFFQVLLTSGYAYAYWLVSKLTPRRQAMVHLSLLGLAIALLILNGFSWDAPTLPDATWRPQDTSSPLLNVLTLLMTAVGVPYFLLATNSTLMQAWFNRDLAGQSPYWLYALSNIGSLLGLLSYPILIEPLLSLDLQSWLWSASFGTFAVMVGYLSVKTMYRSGDEKAELIPVAGKPVNMVQMIIWALMAAIASLMLLATTSQITQEVAAVPFLWVLPLTAYILSFILTFSGERWYDRWVFIALLFIVTIAYIYVFLNPQLSIVFSIIAHLALLFVISMICHGELYRLRPDPVHLTNFYLMVSAGGALGGILVNLIAPYIFNGYWEFQIGLIAAWLLVLALMLTHTQPFGPKLARPLTVAVLVMVSSLVGIIYIQVQMFSESSRMAVRNFYGVLRVTEMNADDVILHTFRLSHGITNHGFQYVDPAKRNLPTAYYTEESGIGLAFLHHPKRPASLRVGVLGLGIGVLASYGQPGDIIRFYEINPAVVGIAEGQYFSYLKDSKAEIQITLGDARLALERELSQGDSQQFDLLVLDTFSSDSIPSHLLTREAFDLYLNHLAPGGILALHVTNRYLDLSPIVWQLANQANLDGIEVHNTPTDGRGLPSVWILLSRNVDTFANSTFQAVATLRPLPNPNLRLWTDDYSNLFQILR